MSKKKPTKGKVDWKGTLITALVDLLVGAILLILDRVL